MKKYYVLYTSDGDKWVYETRDEAERTRYIFGGAIIEKTEEEVRVCPKCGKRYLDYPAISRKDNKTEICPQCGTQEAIEEFFGGDK